MNDPTEPIVDSLAHSPETLEEDLTMFPQPLAADRMGWSAFNLPTDQRDETVAEIDAELVKLVMASAEL